MTFLRNSWYVAANASELEDGLVARTICGEAIVMYRTSDAKVAALEDRCPHRFVPLSMGHREGDALRCGYHGLLFNGAGTCIEMPNDDRAPNVRACVRSYPAIERYGVVWLWMGAADLADPESIPDFDFISNKAKFTAVQGYSYMKANYELVVDNLLDLSHVHYLHPQLHTGSQFSQFLNKVRKDNSTVWSMLWRPTYALDDARKALYCFDVDEVEGSAHGRWDAPGAILVFTSFWEHGKTVEDGVEAPSAHFLTPETEFSTHYFFASGRTYQRDNPALDDAVATNLKMIFETQDGPMIESQQRALGENVNFLQHRPMILQADAAGVMARRILAGLIRAEQTQLRAVRAS